MLKLADILLEVLVKRPALEAIFVPVMSRLSSRLLRLTTRAQVSLALLACPYACWPPVVPHSASNNEGASACGGREVHQLAVGYRHDCCPSHHLVCTQCLCLVHIATSNACCSRAFRLPLPARAHGCCDNRLGRGAYVLTCLVQPSSVTNFM